MRKEERSALRILIAQEALALCEKLGIKTNAATAQQVADLLVSTHINMCVDAVSGAAEGE